jgi:UDP-3-O-[3-hydroxymyristoyl] glucosamine N-acyltransferase
VTKDITEPGTYCAMFPAESVGTWKRFVARLRRIEALQGRVKKLENK